MKKFLFISGLILMLGAIVALPIVHTTNTAVVYAATEGSFTEQVYTYTDESGDFTITLTSEDSYTLYAKKGTDEATFVGSYTLEGNKLTLYMLGEVFDVMEIHEGNTLTRVDTDIYEPQETEESNYFREKIMPYIIANASGILSALLVVLTTLGKIKAATTELKASNAENTFLKKKNKRLEEDIIELKTEVATIKKNTTDSKEMIKIGFCNNSELVANGIAAEIAKVGENEEENKS